MALAELTRETALAVKDVELVPVEIKAWKMQAYAATLTGEGRTRFNRIITDNQVDGEPDVGVVMAACMIACCVDKARKHVFREEDLQALLGKSDAALREFFEVAAPLSGLDAESDEREQKN